MGGIIMWQINKQLIFIDLYMIYYKFQQIEAKW